MRVVAVVSFIVGCFVSPAHGLTQDYPLGCVKEKKKPCAVLALKKTEVVWGQALVYTSADTLFEIQNNKIYLVRGALWVFSSKPYRIISRFGEVFTDKGMLWAEVSEKKMILKSLKNNMSVVPRGFKASSFVLPKGFATTLSFVEQAEGVAEYSIPAVIDLKSHLRVFAEVFPYHRMNYKDTLYNLGRIIHKATQLSSQWHKSLVERRIASLNEMAKRRKAEAIRKDRLESYLKRIFTEKNNFEEIIRESLNNHEVPYEAGAWEKFQSNLPVSTPFYKSKWFIGGVAVLVLAGIVGYNTIPDSVDPINKSIAQEVTVMEKYSKILGGKEQEATVELSIRPLPTGSGVKFVSKVSHRDLPEEYLSAIKRGIDNSIKSGIRFGYEVVDIEITLNVATFSLLTVSEFAFEAASAMCFESAGMKAEPILLEPIMKVDITVPTQYVGEVMSSLTSRGGLINSMESRTNGDHVIAKAPLAQLFGYSTALRSSTQGRGSFTMEFSHFARKN